MDQGQSWDFFLVCDHVSDDTCDNGFKNPVDIAFFSYV